MNTPLEILLVHLYSNGDCLYATAVARQIKHDFPGCNVTWAIATFCKGIIANNPYVDNVMEIEIAKDDADTFRKLRKEFNLLKQAGKFDEIFITHLMDTNLAYYDGCIRSAIFRAYPHPITVNIQPVLHLSEKDINIAAAFAAEHQLHNYKHVILFEFAPQSKQLNITKELAISVSEKLANNKEVAIILSSANTITHSFENIIDGSPLTFRETAAVTHYCTMLLGCSSGITWISTSDAAKQLPMVQLINPDGAWLNPISRDFKRFGLDTGGLIELTHINETEIVDCVNAAFADFSAAKEKYNKQIPVNFRTSRKIVYNLLCYFEFAAIAKHIKVNREVYGNQFSFYMEVVSGFITAPFKLIKNLFTKKILKKSI